MTRLEIVVHVKFIVYKMKINHISRKTIVSSISCGFSFSSFFHVNSLQVDFRLMFKFRFDL